MTISRRLALSFACLIAILSLVAGSSLVALHREHGSFSHFVNDEGRRLALATAVLNAANERAIAARNIVLSSSDAEREREKAHVVRAHAAVGRNLAELKSEMSKSEEFGEREPKLLEALETVEKKYGPVALAIVELASSGKRDQAILQMEKECRPLLEQLIGAARAYSDYIATEADIAVAESASSYRKSVTLCAVLVGVAVIAALWLARGLIVSITRPLQKSVEQARAVAAGHLVVLASDDRRDELGELQRALCEMTAQLSGLVERVKQGSESILVGSREIAAGSNDLSHRTEQQAGSLQATASSMEQMSASVRRSATVVGEATSLAGAAARAAEEGGAAVEEVVNTMSGIADSARRIAEINAVIDGIAFQTNILALNAAVEAARAGEHGRGFAVVASEVRALAGRSADAAREIKTLITDSVERVGQGSRVVSDAGDKMKSIVQQVREVAEMIEQIGVSAREQMAGITSITDSVAALDQGTQQNAALVEQSSAAAESLRSQSEQLASAVAAFKMA